MSLSKFGFTSGKRTKTGDNETKSKNKKANYDSYKERQIEYEKHRVRSFLQPWGNAFPWVRHTMMMARPKKKCIVKWVSFFLGHWIWDPGHQNFEASVPKRRRDTKILYEHICRTLLNTIAKKLTYPISIAMAITIRLFVQNSIIIVFYYVVTAVFSQLQSSQAFKFKFIFHCI